MWAHSSIDLPFSSFITRYLTLSVPAQKLPYSQILPAVDPLHLGLTFDRLPFLSAYQSLFLFTFFHHVDKNVLVPCSRLAFVSCQVHVIIHHRIVSYHVVQTVIRSARRRDAKQQQLTTSGSTGRATTPVSWLSSITLLSVGRPRRHHHH